MKKIYYWSPCLANIGTVRSTINSAISLSKYSNSKYEVYLINTCGEWNNYEKICLENNIKLINLTFNYYKFLPKKGFLLSRISYLIVFFVSYFPFINILKKNNPNFVICHLITSLPLLAMLLYETNTKFILRISGYPKLNILRKKFWKICSEKLYKITSPTIDLIDQIKKENIFKKDSLIFLPDADLNIKSIIEQKKNIKKRIVNRNEKYFISVGRLTEQKNFAYLIKEFEKFSKINNEYNLHIYGEGEQFQTLENLILNKNLQKRIFLKGFSKEIYLEMSKAKCFLMSSLWEEPGIVLIEAAFNNLFIISSNCKNGPKEFLMNGEAGILFESNRNDALFNKLIEYQKMETLERKKKIFKAKYNCGKYTMFNHFIRINKILD